LDPDSNLTLVWVFIIAISELVGQISLAIRRRKKERASEDGDY